MKILIELPNILKRLKSNFIFIPHTKVRKRQLLLPTAEPTTIFRYPSGTAYF